MTNRLAIVGEGDVVRFPIERRRPPQLVPLAGLQAKWGYSERWFRYRLAEGMPARRWGGRLRFDVAEVEAWLNERYGHGTSAR